MPRRVVRFAAPTTFALASLFTALGPAPGHAASTTVVISQVYGGGGNSGATLENDFIELFNLGTATVSLSGWSVQYTSAGGSAWQVTNLGGSIAPGGYYLIQEAQGAGGTTSLPTPDAIGTIAMGATAGKVALVNSTTALSACPSSSVVDLLGYGVTATCFEGAAGPGLTNTTAALRASSGCLDTDNNAADFSAAAPSPRNSTSPTHPCPTNPSGTGLASPDSLFPGGTTLLTVTVTPGAHPTSTSIEVGVDLSSIGGPANLAFFDDATHGDATAGDYTYSYSATVDVATAPGAKSLPATIYDAESRTGSATIELTVVPPPTNPTGFGAAQPSDVGVGATTLLTVAVTPGANPTSTGLAVTADLSAIGGSANQRFRDDGMCGDASAGDLTFSYLAVVLVFPFPCHSCGVVTLPVTITDAQSRGGSTSIGLALAVDNSFQLLYGSGAASPSTVAPGGTALLTVAMTSGPSPSLPGFGATVQFPITVTTDLSSIGGASCQALYDDGTHGDVTALDNTFSFVATIDAGTSAGDKLLPATLIQFSGSNSTNNGGTAPIALTVTSLSAVGDANARFALVLAGPNPGAPPLRVRFSLPSGAPARLDLIDVSGRAVFSREVESLGAGRHEVRIDSSPPPGIYLVRLRQGALKAVRRVVLVR